VSPVFSGGLSSRKCRNLLILNSSPLETRSGFVKSGQKLYGTRWYRVVLCSVEPDSLGCDLRPRLAFPVELSSSFRKTEFELSCRKKAHNLEEFTQIARVHNIALMFSMSHIRSVWNDQHLTLDRFGSSRDTASPKGDKDTQDHWLGLQGLTFCFC
jgi:hypothetical protein